MSSKISLQRPFFSYSRVQKAVGKLIRNSKWQLNWKSARLNGLKYLDVGCGWNTHDNFINVDYLWHPKIDICWDITCGLPFQDSSIEGIYTEHCLEHFSLPTAVGIMSEFRRILCPGGVLRIVVPDGELYMDIYNNQTIGDNTKKFPFQDREAFNGICSPILSVNRIFYFERESLFGHRFIYDTHLMIQLLKHCGFGWAKKTDFRVGADSHLLLDSESRRSESLYVEAGLSANG
jgi:predicted SAM-dependent methyltransferase